MRTYLDCIPCFIRQGLEAARSVCHDEAVITRALKRVLAETSTFDLSLSPPEMGREIHKIIREETGSSDPYRTIKDTSITLALNIEERVQKIIYSGGDAFERSLRFSIAGNILDFALLSTWDDSRIEESFAAALVKRIDGTVLNDLRDRIANAKNVLFLADNAGETVFDRMFIGTFPGDAPVTYAVKGGPIINDATLECALKSGLHKVSRIIDNGSDAPGTVLGLCSSEFKKEYETADVVIAKGQANFETLNDVHRQVYFLLQMKCSVIGDHYGYTPGDWLVGTTETLK